MQKIRVQRVGRAVGGQARRTQRLSEHLPAKHPLADKIVAAAPEQVFFEFFQIQNVQKFMQLRGHKKACQCDNPASLKNPPAGRNAGPPGGTGRWRSHFAVTASWPGAACGTPVQSALP